MPPHSHTLPSCCTHTQVRDLVGRVMANVYLAEGGGGEVKVELSPTPIRPPPPAEPQNAAAPSTAAVVVVAEAVETGAEAPAAPELRLSRRRSDSRSRCRRTLCLGRRRSLAGCIRMRR